MPVTRHPAQIRTWGTTSYNGYEKQLAWIRMTEFYPSLWFFVFCQICLIFTSASADRSQTIFSKFNIGAFDAVWYFESCSTPSLVLYWCLTSQWGTCWDCCLNPIPTAPAWKFRLSETFKISRFLSIAPTHAQGLWVPGAKICLAVYHKSRIAFPTLMPHRHPG